MMADEEVKPDSNNAASAVVLGSQTTQQQLLSHRSRSERQKAESSVN